MSESGKITDVHRSRAAVIYVRQSTLAQVERNTESTARQYDLAARARQLGWPPHLVRVVDGDLGVSGSVTGQRDAFEGMVAEVALGQVGIILALEVSRLARDNAAWYRLLDLAGVCDTLVADADGLYHPGLFNDRLVLGMKGLMSEAELHVLRARLEAGSRTRPPAASCAAACRSGWSGARVTGRSASTPMRPSPASSPRCSSSSRSAGRCGPPGCGCAGRACAGRCSKRSTCTAGPARSRGRSRPTTRCTIR